MKRIAMQARCSWTLLRCCIAVHLPDCRSFGGQCSCKETWPQSPSRRYKLFGYRGPQEPHSYYLVVQRVLRCSKNPLEFSLNSLNKLWNKEIKCLLWSSTGFFTAQISAPLTPSPRDIALTIDDLGIFIACANVLAQSLAAWGFPEVGIRTNSWMVLNGKSP